MQRICITDGEITMYANLNNTVAAKEFKKRLPYTFNGVDSGIDYCCSAPRGVYDPVELQTGWKNGDISLGGGYFAILYAGEEASGYCRNMMIIGSLEKESMTQISKLANRVSLYIEMA